MKRKKTRRYETSSSESNLIYLVSGAHIIKKRALLKEKVRERWWMISKCTDGNVDKYMDRWMHI